MAIQTNKHETVSEKCQNNLERLFRRIFLKKSDTEIVSFSSADVAFSRRMDISSMKSSVEDSDKTTILNFGGNG